jgi:actin-like ATPase involved in cell morphogenesis
MIFEKFIDKENPPVRAKRISFDDYDMEHLYSMAIDNFEDNCIECQYLKKRIEKFLGEEIVNEIKKSISKKV